MIRSATTTLLSLAVVACASPPKESQMPVADITAKGAKRLTGPEVRSLMSGAKMEGNAWSSGTSFTSTMNPNGTFDGVTVNGRKFDGTWSVNDSSGQACTHIRNAPPGGSPCAYTYGLNGAYYISDSGEPGGGVVERRFTR